MNCTEIRELLSAFFDGELPDDSRSRVSSHVEACPACAEELAGIQKLSDLAHSLPVPVSPAYGWEQLARQLDNPSAVHARHRHTFLSRRVVRFLAVAAAFLLVAGVGWSGYRMWSRPHQHAAVFQHYLAEFEQDPSQAQNVLLAKYPSTPVDIETAVRKLGYRPAVANGLPEGYAMESTYVMDMPCCTCVQTLCRRRDGSILVVFEHDNDQSDWFHGRSCTAANCGGKDCSVVNLDSQLAASWQHGKRYLTIIGARNMQEIDKLVSWFNGHAREGTTRRQV